jgi:Uma2 family endonuclease
MAEKVADYLAAGCPMVVVIDPDARNVTVHRPGEEPLVLKDSDTLDGGDVVPGWRMPVREIFS